MMLLILTSAFLITVYTLLSAESMSQSWTLEFS